MVRRDGSERGDEYLHYACGMPWSEHTMHWWDEIGGADVGPLCPDDPRLGPHDYQLDRINETQDPVDHDHEDDVWEQLDKEGIPDGYADCE